MTQTADETSAKRRKTDCYDVSGSQLIGKIKEAVKTTNARTIRIKAGKDFSVEMPITVGVIGGGVVVLAAPWLAVIGVIAAMVSHVTVEVERDEDDDQPATGAATPASDTATPTAP